MQPKVTKFCGVFSKLKSRERSRWSEEMYLDAAMKVYADCHTRPFEFIAAWKELKDIPKWTSKLTSETSARTTCKRKAGEDCDMARPEDRKVAKKKQNIFYGASFLPPSE
ncbi:hypothetical protein PF010_g25072 [Phytophthora fragariae]|uniref:No apical meristem-associated C-terminal domain-containing protein n=1 Tax=Phytophthora fragariae TaxID=53985 RepID=A0A6A3R890_9STRA|nr:hypothetical protein PF009_g26005 [Phytophthora fragariae]KAE9073438.1 hypothetical protein PF010_g25072 [Phytophthora fragariae]KAE9092168.1 hypothetical protein PF006_g24760 [Phytophthora fragariae]KAE9293229.1 hypothetical protein PF008_g24856 [Phytophthora fragariae]